MHSPELIDSSGAWSAVSTDTYHTCGIKDGNLYCWGRDQNGQIGNGSGSSADVESPELIDSSGTWTNIVVGNSFSCGINGGSLYCWGFDYYGTVGNGSGSNANVHAWC
ncbi:MAG: hypothetical protein R2827_04920 [Bdellovibrionales bacterium]